MGLDTSWTDAHWHEVVPNVPNTAEAKVSKKTSSNKSHCASTVAPKIEPDPVLDDLMAKTITNGIHDAEKEISSWRSAGRAARLEILMSLDAINYTMGYGKIANLTISGPKSQKAHTFLCRLLDRFYSRFGFDSAANAIDLDSKKMKNLSEIN